MLDSISCLGRAVQNRSPCEESRFAGASSGVGGELEAEGLDQGEASQYPPRALGRGCKTGGAPELSVVARSAWRLWRVEMPPDGFGGFSWDDRGQGFGRGLLDIAEAAEVGEQSLAGLRAYAGDIQ